ncbi:MAG: hypothetical protein AMXMBFR12_07700 [Candidatus Babeliales bacterium]
MKKTIVLILICSISMCMEQPPQVGSKRGIGQVESSSVKVSHVESDEDIALAETMQEKNERRAIEAKERIDLANQIKTNLPDLPPEIQHQIVSAILDAQGPTQLARLNNSAEHIRNYMQTSKVYYEWLNSAYMVDFIIRELAHRYTRNTDFVAVVKALATDMASRWLGQRINAAISVNLQGQMGVANDEDYNFVTLFNEHLMTAISASYSDLYKVLTKYMEPIKKVWLINNMRIADMPILNYAITHKQNEIVDDLLALLGIDINQQDNEGNTALHLAIKQNDINLVRRILSNPALILDLANGAGDTPLMFAILQGNLSILNELLARGAQVNLWNRYGMSPLMIAIKRQNVPIIQRLLQVPHINVNLQANNRSQTAIHGAINVLDSRILQLLLSAQVNPPINLNIKDTEGFSPLHRAVRSPLAIDLIQMLLQAGANINEKDDGGFTPLMHAAIMYESDPLILLMQAGAAINERDNNNHTALWHANNEQQEENADLLLKAGGIQ